MADPEPVVGAETLDALKAAKADADAAYSAAALKRNNMHAEWQQASKDADRIHEKCRRLQGAIDVLEGRKPDRIF